MNLSNAILRRINEIAEDKKITPGAWAMKAGVFPNTFYAILDKRSKYPKISTLKLLCNAVGMTLSEFFNVDYIEDADIND